jgi:hypothetical protein
MMMMMMLMGQTWLLTCGVVVVVRPNNIHAACTFVANTDINKGESGPYAAAATPQACCELCSANASACDAAVWIPYRGGECWFKHGPNLTAVPNEGAVACWTPGHTPPEPPQPPPPPPPALYSVEVVSVGQQPVLGAQNPRGMGYSPYGFTYNPAWVEASEGTNGVAGVFVRLQNCRSVCMCARAAMVPQTPHHSGCLHHACPCSELW